MVSGESTDNSMQPLRIERQRRIELLALDFSEVRGALYDWPVGGGSVVSIVQIVAEVKWRRSSIYATPLLFSRLREHLRPNNCRMRRRSERACNARTGAVIC